MCVFDLLVSGLLNDYSYAITNLWVVEVERSCHEACLRVRFEIPASPKQSRGALMVTNKSVCLMPGDSFEDEARTLC